MKHFKVTRFNYILNCKRIFMENVCIDKLNIKLRVVTAVKIVRCFRGFIYNHGREKPYLFYVTGTWPRSAVIIRHRDVTACIILVGMVILPFSRHRFTSTVFIGFLRPTTFLYSIPEKNVSSLHSREGVTSSDCSYSFIVATICYWRMFGRITVENARWDVLCDNVKFWKGNIIFNNNIKIK